MKKIIYFLLPGIKIPLVDSGRRVFVFLLIAGLVSFIGSDPLSAQEPGKIRLTNKTTGEPVTGAVFKYDTQSGLSDHLGFISFRFVKGTDLYISHISFGKWVLKSTEVQESLQKGVFSMVPDEVSLYPVTVIGLRSKTSESETYELDYGDKMFHDVGSILSHTPLFNGIKKGGNYGFDPVFRGFKNDQINIVLNGAQSATAACPNRMDPPTSHIASNMIDHVEILKGPHSLRFGNAFGATLNFVQAEPVFSDTIQVYGRASSGFESNGMIIRNEALAGFRNKLFDLGFYGSWSQGDDYKDGNGEIVQADFKRGSLGANLGIKIPGRQKLNLSAIRDFARDADFPSLMMDLRTDDTWMLNARHEFKPDSSMMKTWTTTVYTTTVSHMMDNLLKIMEPRMLNATTNASTKTYGGKTEGIWDLRNSTLFAGADLRIEEATGIREREFLMGPNAGKTFSDNAWQNGKISKSALFTEYHLHLQNLQLVFSGRIEMNVSGVSVPMPEFTKLNEKTQATQFNPGLSAGGIFRTGMRTSVGFWAGHSQRSGSLPERFINYFPIGQDPYEMLGNPVISPETNNQVDLTYEYKTHSGCLNMDLFASWLGDYISSVVDNSITPRLASSPGVRRFINISKAFKTGFEFDWHQELFAGLKHDLGIAFTYGEDRERDEPLPEIAPLDLRYRLNAKIFKGYLNPEITIRHVLEQNRVSKEFSERKTPSFTTVDIEVTSEILRYFTISAGIRNLLNEAYYEHLTRAIQGSGQSFLAPGRSFFLSASFNL